MSAIERDHAETLEHTLKELKFHPAVEKLCSNIERDVTNTINLLEERIKEFQERTAYLIQCRDYLQKNLPTTLSRLKTLTQADIDYRRDVENLRFHGRQAP